MGERKDRHDHYENVVDAETFVRELSQFHDPKPTSDGRAVAFEVGDSTVYIRPSKSKGIAVDVKPKDET